MPRESYQSHSIGSPQAFLFFFITFKKKKNYHIWKKKETHRHRIWVCFDTRIHVAQVALECPM